jgi:N-acetyl-gamma-glutamyl-phosphate reductase
MGARVAVAGASGYAGGELLRLLAGHPDVEIVAVTAHERAGEPLVAVHPQLALDLPLRATEPTAFAGADLVFLALPHGRSAAVAAALPATTKVVDLGADHRLHSADAWADYYGGPHAGAWTYGLPELPGQRAAIAAADRVANTGCYAVATILALAPLIAGGLACPVDAVVVAASGTSGAGRGLKANLMASEVMGSLTPYKVGAHQHVPEIKQATGAHALSFTPILAPMPRGILATVTARALVGATPATVRGALAYRDEPFVRLLPDGVWPSTGSTLGSNAALLQSTVDKDSGRIVVTCAIDNLGKGAAGQAVQCANLMLGLPETAGLSAHGIAP